MEGAFLINSRTGVRRELVPPGGAGGAMLWPR